MLMCLSIGLFAQSNEDQSTDEARAAKMAEKMTSRMVSQLRLEEDQAKDLLVLNTDFSSNMLKLSTVEEKDAFREEMKAEYKANLEKILTDEQFKIFEDKLEPVVDRTPRGKRNPHTRADKMGGKNDSKRSEKMRAKKEMYQNMSEEDRSKMKEGKEKVRAYTERNIIPALQRFRADFDSKLSDGDRALIADARKQKAAKRAAWEAKKGAACDKSKCDKASMDKKKCDASKSEIKIGDRPGPRGLRSGEEGSAHREGLKRVAENHKEALQEVSEKVKPLAQKWKADIERIEAAYMPADVVQMKAERKENRKKSSHAGYGKFKKLMGGVGFLMLDHTADPSSVLLKGRKKGPKRTCGTPTPGSEQKK